MQWKRRPERAVSAMLLAAVVPVMLALEAVAAPQQPATGGVTEGDGLVLGTTHAAAPAESAEARDARVARQIAGREQLAERAGDPAAGLSERNEDSVPSGGEIQLGNGDVSEDVSEANALGRNFRNTVAQTKSSTLAEPATAKDDVEAIYIGNNGWVSRSANSGSTWTSEPAPSGPTAAPFVCCDADALHHSGLDTTFWSMLYLNSGGTRGIVRMFVRRATIAGGNDCFYDFDPGVNRVADYPHIGVSSGQFYLMTNVIDTKGTSSQSDDTWVHARVIRVNASQMANCSSTLTQTSFIHVGTVGQRVFTPVDNATTTMYWGAMESSTSFRIFKWAESAAAPTQTVRSLPHGSAFTNPDCRGGTGNFDWIEKSTAFSAGGFRMRGAVGGGRITWMWNVNRDASHLQAHVHAATFRESDLVLIASPHIFNQDTCIAFPVVGGNSQGDLGVSFAAGGKFGGGGSAAQGFVIVEDETSAGVTFNGLSATLTASGTHNRSDARYGDYFTIDRNERCPLSWVATNYALLNGNTSASNVNARYVEFRSSFDPSCP